MNTLERTLNCLLDGSGEVLVDPALIPRAVKPLKAHARLHPGAAAEGQGQRLRARPRTLAQDFFAQLALGDHLLLAGIDPRGQLIVAGGALLGEASCWMAWL